jgi:hypothetical protein
MFTSLLGMSREQAAAEGCRGAAVTSRAVEEPADCSSPPLVSELHQDANRCMFLLETMRPAPYVEHVSLCEAGGLSPW